MNIQQNLAIRLMRVLRYNKTRYERALELMPAEQRPLFHVLPFLLHINHPAFPGYVEDPDTPYGLNNYSLRKAVVAALQHVFSDKLALLEQMATLWPKRRTIDSLVLMGSIGSIGQSDGSDFDYWVCFDGEKLAEKEQILLRQKLTLIEQWADANGMEAHFFLSEINKVRNNDFGEADEESSGSAQAVSLKAEFYTTQIVVAGKVPFWWLVPKDTDDRQYHQLLAMLEPGQQPDPNLFVDLGHLQEMEPSELFGAAIWQITKAMDSPFKSVLKMGKLEVFLENVDRKPPLCTLLKHRVHSGGSAPGGAGQVDPYALMFDELIEHYQSKNDQDVVALLQLCLYLKCDCALSRPAAKGESEFKRQVITDYVRQWQWGKEKILQADNIKQWSFNDKLRLSRQVHSYLIASYRRISTMLGSGKQTVSPEDMTVIGRKIDTFYSKKEHKIEYLRSVFDDELYCPLISVKAYPEANQQRTWAMYAGDQVKRQRDALDEFHLQSNLNPIDLMVWGVWNRILDNHTRILLDYQTMPVIEDDLYKLVAQLVKYFSPMRVSHLSRSALLAPAKLKCCLAVVNFESRRLKGEVESLRVIYLNTWGELYCEDGFEALASLRTDIFDPNLDVKTCLLVPEGSHKQRLVNDFHKQVGFEFQQQL